MTEKLNVCVIGGGLAGMTTAVLLAEQGAAVTVIEANGLGSGSSGRSVGVIGTQFTDPFEIALRKHAFFHFRRWQKQGFKINEIGYLRLARTAEHMDLFEQSVRLQAEAGFGARLYQVDELQSLIPHLSTDGLAGGIFGADNGFIDPYDLCNFLADKVRALGGTVRQACALTDVRRAGGQYVLSTTKGDIACDKVVNAAGAWAGKVAAMFGQTLHIRPERHEALTIHLEKPLDYTMPMVMDLVNGEGTGLNFRHEKPGELIAEIHRVKSWEPENPDNYNDQCEDDSRYELAELLLERVPDLTGASLGRGWAGLYPVTSDHRPFVGLVDPKETGLITAGGGGGYGIQLSPVIGQAAADWVLHGFPVSCPEAQALVPSPERNVPSTGTAH